MIAQAEQRDAAADSETGYSVIRIGVPHGTPITVLHIGMEQTTVATGSEVELEAVLSLAIGSGKTAAEYFKYHPPTADEVENAILAVEDEVMRARTICKEDSALFSTDIAIREIALLASVPNQLECILSLDALERLFQNWVAVTLGQPASQQGNPQPRRVRRDASDSA